MRRAPFFCLLLLRAPFLLAGCGSKKESASEPAETPRPAGRTRSPLPAPRRRPQSAQYLSTIGPPCVLASERPSHPDDEQGSAKPSTQITAAGDAPGGLRADPLGVRHGACGRAGDPGGAARVTPDRE